MQSSRSLDLKSVLPSYRLHTIFLFCFTLGVLGFLAFVTVYTSKSVQSLRIRNDHFEEIVMRVCTNYIASILAEVSAGTVLVSPDSDPPLNVLNTEFTPYVVASPDIGFSTSYNGRSLVMIDGVRYAEGDFCDYGYVISIGADRAYCSVSNRVAILRHRAPIVSSVGGYKRLPPTDDTGAHRGEVRE